MNNLNLKSLVLSKNYLQCCSIENSVIARELEKKTFNSKTKSMKFSEMEKIYYHFIEFFFIYQFSNFRILKSMKYFINSSEKIKIASLIFNHLLTNLGFNTNKCQNIL